MKDDYEINSLNRWPLCQRPTTTYHLEVTIYALQEVVCGIPPRLANML